MTTVSYSSLSADQRARVAYLFADDLFGTDAGAYLYEVNAKGDVERRCQVTSDEKRVTSNTRRVKTMRVTAVSDEHVTAEQVNNAMMHMDALAVSIAERLYQRQLEEVTQ